VARNQQELITTLKQFISEKRQGVFYGNSRTEKTDLLLKGAAGRNYIKEAIANRELDVLAQLWVKGAAIDWSLLYDDKPSKVSLPNYPFERKRYWFDNDPLFTGHKQHSSSTIITDNNILHPLLHSNQSTFAEQKFMTTFSQNHPLVKDHKLQSIHAVPLFAYIEMAYEAIRYSTNQQVVSLEDIFWFEHITVSSTEEDIHCAVVADAGLTRFELYQENTEDTSNEVIYIQGQSCSFQTIQSKPVGPDFMAHHFEHKIFGKDVYQHNEKLGLYYGSNLQTIDNLHVEDSELLLQLKPLNNTDHYSLLTQLLESITQAVVYYQKRLVLPTKFKQFTVMGDFHSIAWLHITISDDEQGTRYDAVFFSEESDISLQVNDIFYGYEKNNTVAEEIDSELTTL